MTKVAVGGLRLLPAKAKTMDVERVRADLLQAYEVDLNNCQRRNTFGFGRPSGAASRLR